ncbi:MAG: hypothetical protein OXC93_10125 [Rhodospirillaceae bacterium]|nr:hypothetical protein [Rhodospirillaceae bacterium]
MIGTGTEIRVLGRPADDGKKAKALSGQSAIADSSDTIESGQDESRHHCEDKLARYKRYKLPRKLVIRDGARPRNATGNLQKHLIRDSIADWRRHRVTFGGTVDRN